MAVSARAAGRLAGRMLWTPDDVRALRMEVGLDVPGFARAVGVDARTVHRWEAGLARPSGASEAVLNALREKLTKDPATAQKVAAFVVGAAAVGGLAYLLVKLLDTLTDERR